MRRRRLNFVAKMKKFFGYDSLLKLALLMSLLRIDPDAFLFPNFNSNDLFSDVGNVFEDVMISDFINERQSDANSRHPKSVDSAMERIMDDLNDLGRYTSASFRPRVDDINAYVLNAPDGNPSNFCEADEAANSDSDSGISDGEACRASSSSSTHSSDESDGESNSTPLIIEPEDVENELVHLDDQLVHIEDSLDNISEEFLHLDEQLAAHMQMDDEEAGIDDVDNEGFLSEEMLSNVDYNATPFDEWLTDANAGIDDLLNNLEPATTNDVDEVSFIKHVIAISLLMGSN